MFDLLRKVFPFAVMSFAGENDAGGGTETTEGEEGTLTQEEAAVLQQELADSKQRLEAATKSMSSPEYLEYLADRAKAARGDAPRRDAAPAGDAGALDLSKVDWDAVGSDPKKLFGLIVTVLKQDFKGVAQGIDAELSNLSGGIEDLKTAQAIDRCAGMHEDFWDYKDEIVAAASENPSLTPEQAYQQVIGKMAVEGRYKPPASREREARGTGQDRGAVSSGTTRTAKPKNLADAIEAAWSAAGLEGETL